MAVLPETPAWGAYCEKAFKDSVLKAMVNNTFMLIIFGIGQKLFAADQ